MSKSLLISAALLSMLGCGSLLGCGAGVIDGPAGEGSAQEPVGPSSSPRELASSPAPSASGSSASESPAPSGSGSAAAPTSDPPSDAGAPPSADAGSPPPPAPDATPAPAPAPTPKYVKHEVTFYGWADNSPPGAGIRYPSLHTKAGGVGTFADPLTFATDSTEWAPGTKLYLPLIQKYVVMEDSCTQCVTDWKTGRAHIDVWMNSSSSFSSALLACEKAWTRDDIVVEVDPPDGRAVSKSPLFDTATGLCKTP